MIMIMILIDNDNVLNPGESAILEISLENEIGWIDASPVGNMILDKYKHKKKIGFDIIYKQITKKIALKLFANVC